MKNPPRVDAALLILRIGLGLIFLYYGSQKMFGVFGGTGYVGTVNGFIGMGIPPLLAHLAILAEFGGGVGMLLGFLTHVAGLGLVSTMAVATYLNATKSMVLSDVFVRGDLGKASSIGYPLALMFMALAVTLTGAGRFSLDAKYFRGGGKR